MIQELRFITYFLCCISSIMFLACSEVKKSVTEEQARVIIFQEDFTTDLDPEHWIIEMDDQPNSSVTVQEGKLVLDTKGGVTVWLNQELEGDFEITYDRRVIVEDGPNDRLSDLNQFWLARDPNHPDAFTRSGVFEEYDDLEMYYVGFGGNYNSSTRFRKYRGDGVKPVLQEYDEAPYLLEANQTYTIKTTRKDGKVSFRVDDRLFFEYEDADPIERGYFGFRSTWSRQEIDHITILQLK